MSNHFTRMPFENGAYFKNCKTGACVKYEQQPTEAVEKRIFAALDYLPQGFYKATLEDKLYIYLLEEPRTTYTETLFFIEGSPVIAINNNPKAPLTANFPLPIRIQRGLAKFSQTLTPGKYEIRLVEDSIGVYHRDKGLIWDTPLTQEELEEIKLYT